MSEYPTYENVVERHHAKCVASKRIGSYQGDYYMIVRRGRRFGWIDGSFGSCSGCDEIEAAEGDQAALDAIGKRMVESVDWKSKAALLAWIDARDWLAQPGWYGEEDKERREAVGELRAALEAAP